MIAICRSEPAMYCVNQIYHITDIMRQLINLNLFILQILRNKLSEYKIIKAALTDFVATWGHHQKLKTQLMKFSW